MVEAFQVFVAGWIFLVLALCAVGVIALLVGGLWMYHDAQSRRMDATLWLIILILGTLFGAGIPGFAVVLIIYLIVRESHPVGGMMTPAYMPPGYAPSQAPPVPAACPVCGRPMMWYAQYGRWYCPT